MEVFPCLGSLDILMIPEVCESQQVPPLDDQGSLPDELLGLALVLGSQGPIIVLGIQFCQLGARGWERDLQREVFRGPSLYLPSVSAPAHLDAWPGLLHEATPNEVTSAHFPGLWKSQG